MERLRLTNDLIKLMHSLYSRALMFTIFINRYDKHLPSVNLNYLIIRYLPVITGNYADKKEIENWPCWGFAVALQAASEYAGDMSCAFLLLVQN